MRAPRPPRGAALGAAGAPHGAGGPPLPLCLALDHAAPALAGLAADGRRGFRWLRCVRRRRLERFGWCWAWSLGGL